MCVYLCFIHISCFVIGTSLIVFNYVCLCTRMYVGYPVHKLLAIFLFVAEAHFTQGPQQTVPAPWERTLLLHLFQHCGVSDILFGHKSQITSCWMHLGLYAHVMLHTALLGYIFQLKLCVCVSHTPYRDSCCCCCSFYDLLSLEAHTYWVLLKEIPHILHNVFSLWW